MTRQLVVNADDLGLTVSVNDGIFDTHDRGILTSASLFANAPATTDAIVRAGAYPSLGVGAHLSLVDGIPLCPPHRVASLADRDGRFHPSWKPFIAACVRGRVALADIERELTAQIDRLRSSGIALTHLDAHQHVHAYPPIFAIVARLANRFGIESVRNPFERVSPLAVRGSRARRQALLNAAMWPWASRNAGTAARCAVRAPMFVGRIHTGVLDRASLRALLSAVAPGVTELMVHPGYVDESLRRMPTRLVESRQQEVELLCRLETRALVAAGDVELVRHDRSHSIRRVFRHVS